jgi:hypothetical protein
MPKFQQLLVFSLLAASNKATIDNDIKFVIATHLDSTMPKGSESPLHHTCRNNNTEGAACGLLSAGIRHSPPAAGLVKFLGHAAAQLWNYKNECMGVDCKVHQFTPIGSRWCMDAADGANIGLELT